MCLFLFAISFAHFGSEHPRQAWSGEIALHHAGLPLALFVLLQDYRFVMLDAFVRFLANALLAAGLTWVMILAAFRMGLVERTAREPVAEALLLIGVCLLLAALEEKRQWFEKLAAGPAWAYACAAAMLLLSVELIGVTDVAVPFVYFQF